MDISSGISQQGTTPGALQIVLGWPPDDVSGWGVLGMALARGLGALVPRGYAGYIRSQVRDETMRLALHEASAGPVACWDDPILLFAADRPGDPLRAPYPTMPWTAKRQVAITFTLEPPSGPALAENIAMLDRVYAGSSWCADLVREAGFSEVEVWAQGVGHEFLTVARERQRWLDRFVVFGGGKLEVRKGQDIAAAAFRIFHSRHPDALLVACWDNPHLEIAGGMALASHAIGRVTRTEGGQVDLPRWIAKQGIPADAVAPVSMTSHAMMPAILAQCDVALLPSRCEAGTNLVLMECMAAGLPCIATAWSGHLDIIDDANSYPLRALGPVRLKDGRELALWREPEIEEVVDALERAYADHEKRRAKAERARTDIAARNWLAQLDKLRTSLSGLPRPVGGDG